MAAAASDFKEKTECGGASTHGINASLKSIKLLAINPLRAYICHFSTDYATGSAALQQFIRMSTYEELDAHTFYYLVGFNSVTLPASRQGMLMGE
jgi:hypothetical protein